LILKSKQFKQLFKLSVYMYAKMQISQFHPVLLAHNKILGHFIFIQYVESLKRYT